MNSTPFPTSWAIGKDASWIWEPFENSFFLFNPHSGETHVLNAEAVALLEALQEGAATLPELLARLDVAGDPTPYRAVLEELDRFGLIVPAWT
ncbi:MAG: HPr-rel-A system PqqD family peptide chaperone [Magnetococcales bacterium]|nr:HPr-rel-A system PqqD family peptide chaperone [Magnetococcales bacterium]